MTKQSSGDSKKVTIDQFKNKMYEIKPDFIVDNSNKTLLNDIFLYVNNESGLNRKLDPKKGVFMWGDIGAGKSTLIKMLGEWLRIVGEGYKTINCSVLANQYSANGLLALNSSTYNENEFGVCNPVNRAFDELGREPRPAKHFGNELNVMEYILQCRYELRNQCRTFVTTNITPEGVKKLYGDYIYDRINEIFNIVEVSGKSYRK